MPRHEHPPRGPRLLRYAGSLLSDLPGAAQGLFRIDWGFWDAQAQFPAEVSCSFTVKQSFHTFLRVFSGSPPPFSLSFPGRVPPGYRKPRKHAWRTARAQDGPQKREKTVKMERLRSGPLTQNGGKAISWWTITQPPPVEAAGVKVFSPSAMGLHGRFLLATDLCGKSYNN